MIRVPALAALLAAAALVGCEGYRCSEGIVTDAETGAPLEGVQCDATEAKGPFAGETYVDGMFQGQVLTDAWGEYKVCGDFGGCVPTCPDIHVRFVKAGYVTLTRKNPGDVALKPDPGSTD